MVEQGLYLAVLLVLIALLYELYLPHSEDDLLIRKISRSWAESIRQPEDNRFSTVVIGYVCDNQCCSRLVTRCILTE